MRLIYLEDKIEEHEKFQAGIKNMKCAPELFCFTGGKAALSFLKKYSADMVFLNTRLAKEDGLALAEYLRTLYPRMPVIFLTEDDSLALKAYGIHADGYLVKPGGWEKLPEEITRIRELYHIQEERRIYLQTIPRFEVFVDDRLVPITKKKAKELLALLVDYAGSSVTSDQAINYLWEDRTNDPATKALLRMTAKRLRDILVREKIDDILIEENGVRALDVGKVTCDYYQILQGDERAAAKYHGEYMAEYSWAEMTNASLGQKLNGTKPAF